MEVSLEFDFDRKTAKKDSYLRTLLGTCVCTQIHPDEKDLNKRIMKILPEKISSKIILEKVLINDNDYDYSKTLVENNVKKGTIMILFVKEK